MQRQIGGHFADNIFKHIFGKKTFVFWLIWSQGVNQQ